MMKVLILLFFIGLNISLQAQSEEKTLYSAEKMPEFPGGAIEMYKYVYSNLKYPYEAEKNKITGQVIVQFIVDTEGAIDSIKVIRGLGYGCDEEAKRLIDSMNNGHKWIPGEYNGRSLPVTFTLPIKFALSNKY